MSLSPLWLAAAPAALAAAIWTFIDLQRFVLFAVLLAMILPTALAQPGGTQVALADILLLVALLVGLIYVAQTIQVAAANYEIDGLVAERDDLARQLQTLEKSVLRWGTEATVLERAQRIGLDRLETRIRLPAR